MDLGLKVDKQSLWSAESPTLYTLVLALYGKHAQGNGKAKLVHCEVENSLKLSRRLISLTVTLALTLTFHRCSVSMTRP